MSVLKASSLNLNKISFSDVKVDPHGRKMVYVNLNGGKIRLQTPKMYAPNGIKKWVKKNPNDNDNFEMELSFYGETGTDKNSIEIAEIHKKFKELDEIIKNKLLENSSKWIGKKVSRETLEDIIYKPIVKVPKDKEGNVLNYPSRFKTKIDRDSENGKFLSNKKDKTDLLFFDENKQRIEIDEFNAEDTVQRNSQVITIIELVYLSISATGISVKWKLVQCKLFRNKDTITEYAMLDDEEETPAELPDDLDHSVEGSVEEVVEEQVENVEETVEEVECEVEPEVVEEKVVKPKGRGKKN